jgi:hypothetical protein
MRKLLSSGLMFAGFVYLPVTVSQRQTQNPPAPDYSQDPRFQTLRSFFAKAGCPAMHYVRSFLEAADGYALDWRLLPSISFVESTGGKNARNNNLFGWDSGKAHFSTPTESIHAVGYRLAHSYLYKDKDLDEILSTYNPNADYARAVKSVMQQIARTE